MRKHTYFQFSTFFLQDKLLQFVQNGGDAEFFQFYFILLVFIFWSTCCLGRGTGKKNKNKIKIKK